jgi:AcrR family transcriptional regulator
MGSVRASVNSPDPVDRASPPPGTAGWWRPRYAGRTRAAGRPADLTLDRITGAALAILDAEGQRRLTMRRLADELGTAPSSLYRHVASRDELLVEVVDRVLGELQPPADDSAWPAAVEHLAHELRRVLLAHRSVVLAITTAPLLGPHAMRIRELFWRTLDRHGCEPEFVVQVYAAVMHFVVCSALFAAGAARRAGGEGDGGANGGANDGANGAANGGANGGAWSGRTRSGLGDLVDVLPAGTYPTVIRLAAFGDRPDPDHDFAFGLRALIDGLAGAARHEVPAR